MKSFPIFRIRHQRPPQPGDAAMIAGLVCGGMFALGLAGMCYWYFAGVQQAKLAAALFAPSAWLIGAGLAGGVIFWTVKRLYF